MINYFKNLKEKINLFAYDSKSQVLTVFAYTTFITALFSAGLIVSYYGYSHSAEQAGVMLTLIKSCFGVFITNYLLRLFYTTDRLSFLKRNWIESVMMALLIYDALSLFVFNVPLLERYFYSIGVADYKPIYIFFIQAYILVLAAMELTKYSSQILQLKLKPATLFVLFFMGVIALGTFLLMMPEMTTQAGSMNWLNALFTSASATCVTGLIVVDTATFFTFKGHFVILMLMQVGGIGIVSFASFFAFFLKSGTGIRQHTMLQDLISEESVFSTVQLLRQILYYTLVIEMVGTMFIYSLWDPSMVFDSSGEKFFYSVFHSVSAFCNAGFALFTDGLMEGGLKTSYVLHLAFAALIVLGGLGFPALRDLTSINSLRDRMKKPWKQWKTSTVIAVNASILLIVSGSIVFYLLERNDLLAGMNPIEAAITSIFQSITTRTAGFNTVDIGMLNMPTYILFIFLMFIGASSGSTGGGIKTSTFFIILLAVKATLRGEKKLNYRRRNISYSLLNKAYTIFIFSASFVLLSVFFLTITDPEKHIMAVVFESVSAFCTVGLTMGITPELSDWGKVIIITAMYIGRVGTLTLAFALSSPARYTQYKYPNTNMMVG